MRALKELGSALCLGLILALVVYLTILAPPVKATDPTEDIKGLIDQVHGILQHELTKPQRLQLIEKVTARHLNFREMAKRSLGSTWPTLSQAQQDEFVKVFGALMKAHIANNLDTFAKAKVEYLGEANKSAGSEVRIVVIRPNERIPVNFRLLQEPQGWTIYDMVIDGVSLVDNFHNQFRAIIRDYSYAELMRRLKSRLTAESSGSAK